MDAEGTVSKIKSLFNMRAASANNPKFLEPDAINAEVLRAAQREGRKIGGTLDVPTSYDVYVSRDDYNEYYVMRSQEVCRHLEEVVESFVEECGGMIAFTPALRIIIDPELAVGQCRVDASFMPTANDLTPPLQGHIAPPRSESGLTPDTPDAADAEAVRLTPPIDLDVLLGEDKAPQTYHIAEAWLESDDCSFDVIPGATIGVLRDESRDCLPTIRLPLHRNEFAHQITGRFDRSIDGAWFFTCLGSNGVFVSADGKKKKLEEGMEERLSDGSILQIPEGDKLTFHEIETEWKWPEVDEVDEVECKWPLVS